MTCTVLQAMQQNNQNFLKAGNIEYVKGLS